MLHAGIEISLDEVSQDEVATSGGQRLDLKKEVSNQKCFRWEFSDAYISK